MKQLSHLSLLALMFASVLCLTACKTAVVEPDYARPLGPGESALRKLSPGEWPNVQAAFHARPGDLTAALRRSYQWFGAESTKQHFPSPGIGVSHEHARASALAFWDAAATSSNPQAFEQRIREDFDCYTSVGWNGQGIVLFTGYYSPVFQASRTQGGEYQYPLYKLPADVVKEPGTGKVLGRRLGDKVVPMPTRADIEKSADKAGLKGQELVWMKDRFEAYLAHVQGSAKLILPDQSVMYVGYAGTNGRDYKSVGLELVKDGKLTMNTLSVMSMWKFFRANPGQVDSYINRNDRFVFFQEYTQSQWPSGSLGFPVTAMRTLATDKEVYPRGGVVMVSTTIPSNTGVTQFDHFLLDQDTGGAIRAAGRADIYMGTGPEAEAMAGRQYAEGRLYYFFLKPEKVAAWSQKRPAPTGGPQ